MKIVYVKGWAPRAFFEWFDGLGGWHAGERKLLRHCYFEEISVPAPAVLFGWLERYDET